MTWAPVLYLSIHLHDLSRLFKNTHSCHVDRCRSTQSICSVRFSNQSNTQLNRAVWGSLPKDVLMCSIWAEIDHRSLQWSHSHYMLTYTHTLVIISWQDKKCFVFWREIGPNRFRVSGFSCECFIVSTVPDSDAVPSRLKAWDRQWVYTARLLWVSPVFVSMHHLSCFVLVLLMYFVLLYLEKPRKPVFKVPCLIVDGACDFLNDSK